MKHSHRVVIQDFERGNFAAVVEKNQVKTALNTHKRGAASSKKKPPKNSSTHVSVVAIMAAVLAMGYGLCWFYVSDM